jgi:hypothetical protein
MKTEAPKNKHTQETQRFIQTQTLREPHSETNTNTHQDSWAQSHRKTH